MMNKSGWTNENYDILTKLIYDNKSDDNTEKYKRNYVVFDWDNSSCMYDSEESVFLYQVENLKFKLTANELGAVLKKDLVLSDDRKKFALKIIDEIVSDYEILINSKNFRDEKVYNEFVGKMTFLKSNFGYDLGYKYDCRRILYLFKNFTEEELRCLIREALDYYSNVDLQIKYYETRLRDKTPLKSSYKIGLKRIVQIVDLIRELKENNIEVYICSASSKIVVEEFSSYEKFGYGVNKENVAGLEIGKNEEGKFIESLEKGKLESYLEGKAKFIKSLEDKYKKPPILCIGDSRGDYYMLTYKGLKIGLIVNIKARGNINELKDIAKSKNFKDTIYLLQGRDDRTAEFIDSQDSIEIVD